MGFLEEAHRRPGHLMFPLHCLYSLGQRVFLLWESFLKEMEVSDSKKKRTSYKPYIERSQELGISNDTTVFCLVCRHSRVGRNLPDRTSTNTGCPVAAERSLGICGDS